MTAFSVSGLLWTSKAALACGSDLQRHVHAAVVHVVEDRVPMAERPALDIFAGEADARAVAQNGRVGQLLGQRPVDRALVRRVEGGVPLLAHALQLAVHGEVGRQRQQRPVERLQLLERHAGLGARRGARRRRFRLRLDEILFRLERIQRPLQLAVVLLVDRFDLFLAHTPRSTSVFAQSSRTVGCEAIF